MSRRMAGLTLFAAIALVAPSSGDAQVGGRPRQRIQEAVGGDRKIEPAEIDHSKVFTNGVVEMTAAGVRGLHNGLDTEIRLLTEFAAQLNTYREPEAYTRCGSEVAVSPEAQEIAMRMANLPENATAEMMQRAVEKMNEDMKALLNAKCGGDVNAEWPQNKRDEKLREITRQAAAAAGPVSDPPRPPGGPTLLDDSFGLGVQQGALTPQEYGIWKERVQAYCAYRKLRGPRMPVTPGDGYALSFPAAALDPNAGKVHWFFTANEVVLMDAECVQIVLKIGKITEIIEMPPINIRGRPR